MALYTEAKWNELLRKLGVVADARINEITSCLRDADLFKNSRLHQQRIWNYSANRAMLPGELDPTTEGFYDRAYQVCIDVVSAPGVDAAKYGACEMLGVSLLKRYRRMGAVTRHRAAVTSGPKTAASPQRDWLRAQGRAGNQADLAALQAGRVAVPMAGTHVQLKHRKFQQGQLQVGSGNYWLEKADPLHRAWGHTGVEIYEKWANLVNVDEDFFTWVDQNRDSLVAEFTKPPPNNHLPEILYEDRGVRYLDRSEKFQYRVKFDAQGRLLRRDRDELRDLKVRTRVDMAQMKAAAALKIFSTAGYETLYNAKCFAIWVCSPTGKFYSHRHKLDKFHHSSFLAGDDVLAGGEWAVSNGELVMICDKTGHYGSTKADFHAACKVLVDANVSIENVVYETADYAVNANDRKFYWLWDWYQHFPNNTDANTPLISTDIHACLAWASDRVKGGASPAGEYNQWWAKHRAALAAAAAAAPAPAPSPTPAPAPAPAPVGLGGAGLAGLGMGAARARSGAAVQGGLGNATGLGFAKAFVRKR